MIMGSIETANETWRHGRNDPSRYAMKFPKLPAIGVIANRIPRIDGSLKKNKFDEDDDRIQFLWLKYNLPHFTDENHRWCIFQSENKT